jgi:hypothetical protein
MANHLRQQIREAVGTTLTGLSTTGSNVFQSRVYPLSASNLPGLLIYTMSESSEPATMAVQQIMNRELQLIVEGYAKATSNLDDTLDTIAKEVETAMAGDTNIGGLAKNSYLQATEIQLNGEGEQPIGVVAMTFRIDYMTANNTPDTAI